MREPDAEGCLQVAREGAASRLPDPAGAGPVPPCRACGGRLEAAFDSTVLGDVPVTYHVCRDCRSLMLPEPTWLDRAYAIDPVPDPDSGDLQRSLMMWRMVRRLRFLGLVQAGARTLDFGAGKGVLLRALLDDQYDAWAYDLYPHSVFARERLRSTLPEGPFDLVTAVEVLEHTLDPIQVLGRLGGLLGPRGLLLASTEFYREGVHGSDWGYLAREMGQHVTIFSAQGFQAAAQRAGLVWIGSLRCGGQPFVHVLARSRVISSWTWFWLCRRHHRGEHRSRRARNA